MHEASELTLFLSFYICDFSTGVYPRYFKHTDKRTNKHKDRETHNAGMLALRVMYV